jgi:predicted metal-dependent phosphoesterase TrpH
MPERMLRTLVILFLLLAFTNQCRAQQSSWFKGNTHTHTWNSSGDSSPDDVVKWYRQHGYDFVFLTDQELITDVGPLNALFGSDGHFLVIRGEEVTSNRSDTHIHVNALNPKVEVHGVFGGSHRETLQKDLDLINSVGGLTQINHPNFLWQLTAQDIISVKGVRLF